MFRAMAIKELREIRGVALIGLAVFGLLIASCIQQWMPERRMTEEYMLAPFVNERFPPQFAFVAAVLAIAIGLRQSLGESIYGTYPFLLHRAATRGWLIGMKMLWGMAAYLACGSAAILVYGIWAAVPGHHDSPFLWSMTLPCWGMLLTLGILYFGAFLSGVRPARWFGSRLFPIAAAIGMAIFAEAGIWQGPLQLLYVAVADALMVICILFAVRNRDF